MTGNGHSEFTPRDDFPLASLPKWARDYVEALAHVLQVEPVVIALAVLGATALAVQGKAELAVRGGWIEPLSFWFLAALRSGNRKTPALFRPLAPLRAFEWEENEARRAYRERLRDKKAAKDGGKRQKLAPGEVDAWKEAEPPDLELWGSDFTPESVAIALAEQHEAHAIVTDEPTTLAEILRGMYSESRSVNTGIYMAGYSGAPYRRRRVKGTNARLERPALSMLLLAQPKVFEEITSQANLIELGFVGRMLVCKPFDKLGARVVHSDFVDDGIQAAYNVRSREILATPAAVPLPDVRSAWINDPPQPWPQGAQPRHRLALDSDAAGLHTLTEEEIEPLLAETGALGELCDFGAKLSGLIARMAAFLHVLEHPTDWVSRPVGLVAMGNAVEVGRYALGQVLSIFSGRQDHWQEEKAADYVLARCRAIADDGLVRWRALSKALIAGNGRGRITGIDELHDAIDDLVERGELVRVKSNGRGASWLVGEAQK